jgi:hypothetical protein
MTFWQRLLVWIRPQWRRDEHNPYRRYCLYCDQQQSAYSWAGLPRSLWWEDICPVMPRKPECDIVHPESNDN